MGGTSTEHSSGLLGLIMGKAVFATRSSGSVPRYSRSSSRSSQKIIGMRNPILGMVSHDLCNAKTRILGATPGAIPGMIGTHIKDSHLPMHSRSVFSIIGVVPTRQKTVLRKGQLAGFKPSGFPLLSGKVRIVSRTLSGTVPRRCFYQINRPRKRERTNRENPGKIGKAQERIKRIKKEGQVQIGKPPRLKPLRFVALECLVEISAPKKIFSPPPPKFPADTLPAPRPPAPSPGRSPPPPPGIFNKNPTSPPPGASDSPGPPHSGKK